MQFLGRFFFDVFSLVNQNLIALGESLSTSATDRDDLELTSQGSVLVTPNTFGRSDDNGAFVDLEMNMPPSASTTDRDDLELTSQGSVLVTPNTFGRSDDNGAFVDLEMNMPPSASTTDRDDLELTSQGSVLVTPNTFGRSDDNRAFVDLEMNMPPVNGGSAAAESDRGLLTQESITEKIKRRDPLFSLIQILTISAGAARLFHAGNSLTDYCYDLSGNDDDAVFFNPFEYSFFALISLEIVVGIAYVLKSRWQGTPLNVATAGMLTEFLETSISVIGMAKYSSTMQGQEVSNQKLELFIFGGLTMGLLQLVSENKGQWLMRSSHHHQNINSRPSRDPQDQNITFGERLLNGALRTVHYAHVITLYYALIDVLNTLPLPTQYFVGTPIRAIVYASPFAAGFAITNTLLAKCLWAKDLPSYTLSVDYANTALHVMMNACLAFNAIFYTSVELQLFIDDEPDDLYILQNPVRLYATAIGPALIVVLGVIITSIQQHHLTISEELWLRAKRKDLSVVAMTEKEQKKQHGNLSQWMLESEPPTNTPTGTLKSAFNWYTQRLVPATTAVRGLNDLYSDNTPNAALKRF